MSAWKRFEQEVTRKLKEAGFDALRNWSPQFTQHDTVDIKAPPFMFQLKYGERPSVKEAWIQARTEMKKGEIPIGVARYKGETLTLVALTLKDFLELIRKG